MIGSELPSLDCHAHIAPDVTAQQLGALGNTIVFAVTRSLDEAQAVVARRDTSLLWGCGIHPAVRTARLDFDEDRLARLLPQFGLVGEIGLDRRAGELSLQREVFRSVLTAVAGEPVLLSIHSAGCTPDLLELLTTNPHPGAILHWFTGDAKAVGRATEMGCYFSVNGAMSDEALRRIPLDRMLPETDFPATRRRGGGKKPGDTTSLETRIAQLVGLSAEALRIRWYRNLRTISVASGAIDRLPEPLTDILVPL